MIDAAAYRANETTAKRAIADWRLSNVHDPYIFQNQGFPVRADSFLDLAQILDTMQEGRFDFYMKEIGGFTDEDETVFLNACLDYIDFYVSIFQRDRVVVPLSTLISHFVIYKKLLGYNSQFRRVLEIGPGCGYLSFFLRVHEPLADYTQIESTESFYLLQSHINSHVFGSRFAEHALPRQALDVDGAYIPKLKWHDDVHYEKQKIINVKVQPTCNHYPWWRIGDAANRQYDIVTSNANLNEFSREALYQYLSLIRDVLADDGVIIAQCLGGGAPTYDSVFANMKSAGFVPVALVRHDDVPGRFFAIANGVFVGEKHPLYSKYVNVTPRFPMLDRELGFVNKMYFLNEEQPERKNVRTVPDILHAILDQLETPAERSGRASRQPGLELDVRAQGLDDDMEGRSSKAKAPARVMERILSSAHLRDTNRLRRVARIESLGPDAKAFALSFNREKRDRWGAAHIEVEAMRAATEIDHLKSQLEALQSSNSWRVTAPLRSLGRWARRHPSIVRWVRRLRAWRTAITADSR